jgi:hypothetical protein
MRAVERPPRDKRQMERRAKPARRSSRWMYPKTAARRLHRSRRAQKNQNPQNGQHRARFDWGLGAVCRGASPVAAVFGSAPGSATPPEHRIHSNPTPPADPSKQDISTLLGIGHFYFALTKYRKYRKGGLVRRIRRRRRTTIVLSLKSAAFRRRGAWRRTAVNPSAPPCWLGSTRCRRSRR